MTKCYLNTDINHLITPLLDEMGIEHTIDADLAVDFALVDAIKETTSTLCPAIILSTSGVYSCLDLNLKVREVPISEDSPLVIPNSLSCCDQLAYIKTEEILRRRFNSHMVLRVCNLYGYNVINSLPALLLEDFRIDSYTSLLHSQYCKKSLLYIEDFYSIMKKVIPLFFEGLRGVYNIGGTDVITTGNLAETIYQILHQTNTKPQINVIEYPNYFVNFYDVVDITRIQAITNWKPEYSIRKGIWSYIQKELYKCLI